MKRRITIPTLIIATVLLVQFGFNAGHVFAKKDEAFYSTNSILFYDPDATACVSAGQVVSAGSSSVNVTKSATIDTIYKFLATTPLSSNGNKPLNAAQASGVMGNMYAESGFNPSAIESTSRVDKGHGLVQWTFGRWKNLESFAASRGTAWDDVTTQLEFLKLELEGVEKKIITDSEFSTTAVPGVAAMRFRIVFERADPTVAHDDKREGAAISVFNQYSGSVAGGECSTGDGVVAGNFVKTAIGLALTDPATDGMVNEKQARDTYQAAKPKYNPSVDWTDCGGFIATALYASGIDPNYPNVYVPTQIAYVRGNTAKYIVNENPTINDLQPGDILYTSGHTTLYTGEATYPSVDASLNQRVPSVRNAGSAAWMVNNGAISARLIK
jgi:Phage tail lysozyme